MAKATNSARSQGGQGKKTAKAGAPAKGKGGRKEKTLQKRIDEAKAKRHSIKGLFETHEIVQLKEIEFLFMKSMADQIGINHGRFIDKLKNPVKFSMKDIYKFSYYVDIDPSMMIRQVQKEVEANREVVEMLKKVKPIKEKKKAEK
jgi:hypothetical protein